MVLETAVRGHGAYSWNQFDVRKGVEAVPPLDRVVGIIANKPTSNLMGAWKSKHWYTIRRCRGHDLNLDSKLPAPVAFVAEGQDTAVSAGETLREHLRLLIDSGGSLFLVTQADPEPEPQLEPPSAAT